MEEIYIVISCASGEDFRNDHPKIEGVFTDLENAKECFKCIKKEYAPKEEENAEEFETDVYYETTNFDADYHAVVEIVKQTVNFFKPNQQWK